jgi:hypothetical protein
MSSESPPRPQPPTLELPYWRDSQGRRTSVLAVLAGRGPSEREAVLGQHADAVCAIIHAASKAHLEGRQRDARTLAARASKLCGELAGLWPAGSHAPLS